MGNLFTGFLNLPIELDSFQTYTTSKVRAMATLLSAK